MYQLKLDATEELVEEIAEKVSGHAYDAQPEREEEQLGKWVIDLTVWKDGRLSYETVQVPCVHCIQHTLDSCSLLLDLEADSIVRMDIQKLDEPVWRAK